MPMKSVFWFSQEYCLPNDLYYQPNNLCTYYATREKYLFQVAKIRIEPTCCACYMILREILPLLGNKC